MPWRQNPLLVQCCNALWYLVDTCHPRYLFLAFKRWWSLFWPAHRAGLLRCDFFGQPGNVSKFSPFLWVKLWVGWVGRGYIEINRYFPALWINRVTLVTKIKHWYSLGYYITFESPKCLYGMRFCVSKPDSIFSVYHSSPSSHVRSSLVGWSFILGNTDCNTVPTWWMQDYKSKEIPAARDCTRRLWKIL